MRGFFCRIMTMLSGIHFLLTYKCTFDCVHCFIYCSPRSRGTFTIDLVQQVLDEARELGTVAWFYFEGGEPLLFFNLLQESIRRASEAGFRVGIVSNAYPSTSPDDAELWLRPLAEAGLSFINVSNDVYHFGDAREKPATIAVEAAQRLGIDIEPIRIEPPSVVQTEASAEGRGQPVTGGDVIFRGRAADLLTGGLPLKSHENFTECPFEDLKNPSRVHVDAFGHVQVCQGISIGNLWETPLPELMANYRAEDHPVCGPLLRGGPSALAAETGTESDPAYVSECHLCYSLRKSLIWRYPHYLAPAQVYGLSD